MNWIPAALANWIPAVVSDPAGRYTAGTLGVLAGGCCVARAVEYVSDHRAGLGRRWHALTDRLDAWTLAAQYELTELGIRLAPLVSVRLPRLRLPHRDAADRPLLLGSDPIGPDPRELQAGVDRLLADVHGRHRLVRVPAQRAGTGR